MAWLGASGADVICMSSPFEALSFPRRRESILASSWKHSVEGLDSRLRGMTASGVRMIP